MLFLAIMVGQLIPVKQVGDFLYNNQLIEEKCDAGAECEDFESHAKEGSEKSDCISPSNFMGAAQLNALLEVRHYLFTCFISRQEDDVLTPPPLV